MTCVIERLLYFVQCYNSYTVGYTGAVQATTYYTHDSLWCGC